MTTSCFVERLATALATATALTTLAAATLAAATLATLAAALAFAPGFAAPATGLGSSFGIILEIAGAFRTALAGDLALLVLIHDREPAIRRTTTTLATATIFFSHFLILSQTSGGQERPPEPAPNTTGPTFEEQKFGLGSSGGVTNLD